VANIGAYTKTEGRITLTPDKELTGIIYSSTEPNDKFITENVSFETLMSVTANPDSALYAIITSYLTSTVIDKMVYGVDVQKSAMIITSKPKEVAGAVMEELHRGCTGMDATGMYTGDKRTVLICAVRRHETGTLKKLILEQDEHAFMMISNINEVFGHNFKRLGQ
jgi:uncharacterized membrane-anchored protein YitT (DUF2179 family)